MFFFCRSGTLRGVGGCGLWQIKLVGQSTFFFGKWPVHFKCKGLIYSHVWRIDTVAGKGIEANSF